MVEGNKRCDFQISLPSLAPAVNVVFLCLLQLAVNPPQTDQDRNEKQCEHAKGCTYVESVMITDTSKTNFEIMLAVVLPVESEMFRQIGNQMN